MGLCFLHADLHRQIGTTALFVTHDHEEAFELADRIVLFDHGRVVADDTPSHLWTAPPHLFALRFFGPTLELPGEVRAGRFYVRGAGDGDARERTGAAQSWPAPDLADGSAVLATRQRDLRFGAAPGATSVKARLLAATGTGWSQRLSLDVGPGITTCTWEGEAGPEALALADRVGAAIAVDLPRARVYPLHRDAGGEATR